MNRITLIKEAWNSLLANKLRTALTMLGIIIGVAAVISMLAIGHGASISITSSIQSIGTNLIFVSRNSNVRNAQTLTLADAEALNPVNGLDAVKAVAPTSQTNLTVYYADNSISATILGVLPDYQTVRNEEVALGSFITEEDVEKRATSAVIGAEIATELFGSKEAALGKKIRLGNYLYTVTGVLKTKGGTAAGSSDTQVFIPLKTLQVRLLTRSGDPNAINQITIAATSAETVNLAISQVQAVLRARHKISDTSGASDDFRIYSQESMTEAATSISGVLSLFLGGIASISLLVGGIGIMNVMLISVLERTKEIGLRKALGAQDDDILLQFLLEALMIGFFGGILGVTLGWGISALIRAIASSGSTTLNPMITASSVLLSTLFSIVVALVFGIYPAQRAARLEPVEALRSE